MDPTAFGELAKRLRGPLLLPADAGYDESRSVWNGMIDRRPAAVVRCSGTADVIAALTFAGQHGLSVSVKGGGHNVAGLAVADDALLLDMSTMRGVFVDPVARRVRAQAGCLLGDVDRETQLHGLAAVLGFVSNTGIAGLTLGGGFGYLTGRHGWTSDTVTSIDLVTADGSLMRASEDEHADLLWALRGGGGNFGVATSFEYELFPVGPEIYAGAVVWPIERAGDVLPTYRRLAEGGSPELTCVLALRLAPPAPWIDPSAHGKPVVAVFVCHAGRVEDGERELEPLKAIGGQVGDVLTRRLYTSQQSLLDATQPKGRRYYWKSEYLPSIDEELLDVGLQHSRRIVSPHSAVFLFPFGDGPGGRSGSHSAVGNRDARAVLNVAAAWDRAEDDAENLAWAREAWGAMRRFSTGGVYVNFLTEDEADDRTHAAYRDNYERLAKAKAEWDPENVFHLNKNIAPAAH
ncbi:MAG TPA: FAD-binding oxidoreductase [Candidatus Deferrimicrobiaceae bacterium]|nr:FAD-binding oxidoreductase [Candidatus Deferrimicrobiaceae bacterium]